MIAGRIETRGGIGGAVGPLQDVQKCHLRGGATRLEARREAGRLCIAVENPLDDDAPVREGTGTGLANVRRRLEMFGARGASLQAVRGPGRFRVTLTLPAREEADGA